MMLAQSRKERKEFNQESRRLCVLAREKYSSSLRVVHCTAVAKRPGREARRVAQDAALARLITNDNRLRSACLLLFPPTCCIISLSISAEFLCIPSLAT